MVFFLSKKSHASIMLLGRRKVENWPRQASLQPLLTQTSYNLSMVAWMDHSPGAPLTHSLGKSIYRFTYRKRKPSVPSLFKGVESRKQRNMSQNTLWNIQLMVKSGTKLRTEKEIWRYSCLLKLCKMPSMGVDLLITTMKTTVAVKMFINSIIKSDLLDENSPEKDYCQ